jgi:hypothetical protein
MERLKPDISKQKCWYCKRNDADSEYLNIEKNETTQTTIKGFKKYTKTSAKEWKVVRCKECYEIHQKGIKLTEVVSLITYISSYVLLCVLFQGTGEWIKYIIFLFIALLPTYVFAYLFTLFQGYYYAYKYNIKTRWSRGGDVL